MCIMNSPSCIRVYDNTAAGNFDNVDPQILGSDVIIYVKPVLASLVSSDGLRAIHSCGKMNSYIYRSRVAYFHLIGMSNGEQDTYISTAKLICVSCVSISRLTEAIGIAQFLVFAGEFDTA